MKIAIAQQNYHIGNFEYNTNKIINAIEQAKKDNVDLIVFSELSVCGYPPRDFLEFDDFINKCYESIDLIKETTNNIGVIIGSPQRNPELKGKDLFNSAIFLCNNEIIHVAHKSLLPTYDVFDEYRYFEATNEWKVFEFKGEKIALTICEDIWNLSENPLYRISPMDLLIKENPTILINITASPFDYDHDDDRKEIILKNIRRYHLPMIYCTVSSDNNGMSDPGDDPDQQELVGFEKTTDDEFTEVEHLIERLKAVVADASRRKLIPQEFKQYLSMVLKEYPSVRYSPIRSSVNELIVSECQKYGAVTLKEDEVELLWKEAV